MPNGDCDILLVPSEGLRVPLPTWLEHCVGRHEGEELRIRIAFNAGEPTGADPA